MAKKYLQKFEKIVQSSTKISQLEGIGNLLGWDMETYMPSNAIDARSAHAELISKLIHKEYTKKKFAKNLAQLIDLESGELICSKLSSANQKLIQEIYREWKYRKALPMAFVEEFTSVKTKAQHVWELARKNNDYAVFAPYLQKLIDLSKRKADFLGWQDSPYDALLNEFEPGLTTAQITPLFQNLKAGLTQLLTQIEQSAPPLIKSVWDGLALEFSESGQSEFAMKVLRDMGFDLTRGRVDVSAHPFTTQFHPSDVRLTLRYNPSDLMESLSSAMHEGGHGLYEQNLNPNWIDTILCQVPSYGLHESQSRLWENLIGKSYAFWKGYYPQLQATFPAQLTSIALDEFYRLIHQVKPSLIRVNADEVTYSLHIIVRFEMEKLMINESVDIQTLPELWNQKYAEYLHIKPENLADGILQDVHWSAGYFGYFPSYTIGNLYAVQLMNQLQKEIPNLDDCISRGELTVVTDWLRIKLYPFGRVLSAAETIQHITGQGLSDQPFLSYLQSKYKSIYQF